jgi:hypothetical protein
MYIYSQNMNLARLPYHHITIHHANHSIILVLLLLILSQKILGTTQQISVARETTLVGKYNLIH